MIHGAEEKKRYGGTEEEENEKFVARVIAQRFELNDKYVSIISELVPPSKEGKKESKPRLVL